MKAVAALMAVVAVAVAAPSAGAGGDPSITSITYTTEGGNRKALGSSDPKPVTDVCVDGATLGEDAAEIQLTMRDEDSDQVNNYPAVSITDTCVKFSAPVPASGKSVVYSIVPTHSDTIPPEQLATITFIFQALDGDQITCGDQSFKITALEGCSGVSGPANCFEPSTDLPSPDADMCVTPEDLPDFKYCQPEATITEYTAKDTSPAESLAYSGTLTLGDSVGDADTEVLVVVGDDTASAQAQVLSLAVASDKGSVTLDTFERSTNTYTACPVVADFTAYTINDLHVIASMQTEDKGDFYEIGLMYVDATYPKYLASTPAKGDGSNTMIINCGNLNAAIEPRCYGWVEAAEGDLTVSYCDDDGTDTGNRIILAPDQMTISS